MCPYLEHGVTLLDNAVDNTTSIASYVVLTEFAEDYISMFWSMVTSRNVHYHTGISHSLSSVNLTAPARLSFSFEVYEAADF
jgi:hypothetical protein